MASVNEAIVREYFESLGFLVHQPQKYIVMARSKRAEEEHRLALVRHHSERNRAEPGWCTSAVLTAARDAGADALLLTDLRTRADLQWFLGLGTAAPTLLRVDATDASRHARGSPADPLRDGLPTEIELDRFTGWTACFDNSDDSPAGARLLDEWIHLTVLPRFLG